MSTTSTTSSREPPIAEKHVNSQTLLSASLSGKVAAWVAGRSRVCVSRVARSAKVLDEKGTGLARAWFALQQVKKMTASEHFWKMRSANCAPECSSNWLWTGMVGALLEDEVRKMCNMTVARARHKPKLKGSEQCGIIPIVSATRRCECWSICCDAPAMRVCDCCDKRIKGRLRAVQQEWCCNAPGKWDSWRLLNSL